MFNDPPEEVGRKWCQWSEAEVYLPLFTIHPVFFPLTSSFLLPLLPRCPALSSQNPSPINPSLSSLALLLRLVKTGITGIAKTLIFDHPRSPPRPPLPQYLCHGSGASCMLPPSWLLEISHAWSPERSMDTLLYCKYSVLSSASIC